MAGSYRHCTNDDGSFILPACVLHAMQAVTLRVADDFFDTLYDFYVNQLPRLCPSRRRYVFLLGFLAGAAFTLLIH